MNCDYCGNPAQKATGRDVYPHRPDLASKQFYRCVPCAAFVGCHPDGKWRPLGRLANAELRRAKMNAHAAFDPIWKGKRMRRREAYGWLAGRLGIHSNDCHIGMFDVETCNKVIAICASGGPVQGGSHE